LQQHLNYTSQQLTLNTYNWGCNTTIKDTAETELQLTKKYQVCGTHFFFAQLPSKQNVPNDTNPRNSTVGFTIGFCTFLRQPYPMISRQNW
jgi:hypothetical protein